ncbi:hypothetical protein PRIPAC_95063 [Pristionchus pacificus]|uniref:Serpentine receptor class gamma n=1 Tax=Pristionchus pacificus TaxID=54126 RepID=A0A2A6BAH5_PRIPA|nr:hypothetical protein PRIPAC_95063 [Pristionchus pacificus]|eukprot:PDM62867.1 G protein-coupled receptor [Pristionchus pacificus]
MTTEYRTIPLVIYAIYVPSIFIIYLSQLIIVIVNKGKSQFRSSYFTLFIIEAFTGLATTVATTICFRLPMFPEFYTFYADFPSNAFTSGLYFSSYYFPACQEYVNIFIALNRLSAVVLYKKYEKVWRFVCVLCLPVIFGLPFISYYHLVDTSAMFRQIANGTAWFIDYDHSVRPWRSNRASSFYLYLVCSITSFVINLMTLVYVFTKVEAELTAMNYRLAWLYDLKALSPGILSLIFSSAIRNELVQTLKRSSRSSSVSGII